MNFRGFQKFNLFYTLQFAIYLAVLIFAVYYGFSSTKPAQIRIDKKQAAIENALYTRAEFFGADALVPFPTVQARARLAEVLRDYPGDSEILQKLAALDENLGRFDDAENSLAAIKPENLQALADFYGRRAAFEKQAAALERILENAPAEKRGEAFANLISLARKHDLKKYTAPEFYRQIIARDDASFGVFQAFIEKLIEERDYTGALKIIAENRSNFPALKNYFLEKEIEVLTLQGQAGQAEKIYTQAFDPNWTGEESERFYSFLRERDRFRAYESELRQNFRQNPADFQTAVRLIHFAQNEGGEFAAIVRKLENERRAKKIRWQPDELLTISHFLIESGDGDTASRFLYTLCTDFDVKEKSDLRRRVLYQLFELLSDAGDNRLALTRGNLDFYETVAKSDARPGITTGILSLIFSDTNPRRKFDEKQKTAVKFFNRAAAYRIFEEFKTEYADAPELAQMYLDIVRLYTNLNNLDVAAKTLSEFEQKYTDFRDFPDAALKLSDAFIAAKQFDKEREIYQKLLDFLGKTDRPKFPASGNQPETSDLTVVKPQVDSQPPFSNEGIDVSKTKKRNDYYYSEPPAAYTNFLSRERSEILYSHILTRLVGSLARENKMQEILNLYAAETAKYPSEEKLYEQMLQWLGQTNLAERQMEVYQKALRSFPDKSWKDRFARWLIRNKKSADFEEFSRSVVAAFDDRATQEYLQQFVDGKESGDAKGFDAQLFFALYDLAHKRFPHNIAFVKGLLRYYKQNKMETEWRRLLAEYYFESTEIRREFLTNLAQSGEIGAFLQKAEAASSKNSVDALPYKLFRADASAWVSDFEKAIVFYRELNDLYPRNAEFAENYLAIARSFGQKNRSLLVESAAFTQNQADAHPSNADYRTRAGELQAELGDYEKARANWEKLVSMASGENESYLNQATVFWDYFQFDDALQTIRNLREKAKNDNLFAFQAGAIFEAKREPKAAIAEYLIALDETDNEDDRRRAKLRLKQLFGKPDLAAEIYSAFEITRPNARDPFRLTFNFADTLFQMNRQTEAVNLLLRHIKTEKSKENLLEAKQFFRDLGETEALRAALERLVQTAENPRDSIAFRLQLAENLRENYEPQKSSAVIADLVRRFPANYGVLKEAEQFYWDLGQREKSVEVLQAARQRSRGEYLYQFSRKLAQRFNDLNRTGAAEQILNELLTEKPNDAEVFADLTDVYVRTGQSPRLRETFSSTLSALEKQPLEPRELSWQTEILRKKMISAFTRLKDYDAAAEQYIELINREPENDAILEEAIGFAKRYGGGKKLLEYYQTLAREAFKNYRWNVVLARLYEANGDLPNAAENYRAAIFNQPEMIELYEALGEVYIRTPNLEAALENVEKLLELSNEDEKYIKQKAEILKKLDRKAEADAENAKLPAEAKPTPQNLPDQFAEAQNLPLAETEKAVEKYNEAFENLRRNPFQNGLKSSDITGFVQTVHRREPLGTITAKLWNLREILVAEILSADSLKSGKARENLKILDGAMLDSISQTVKTRATGSEIAALRSEIAVRLDSVEKSDSETIELLHNLVSRCGFDDMLEKILVNTFESSADPENQSQNLRALLGFYQKRSNYRRILEVLERGLADKSLEFLKFYAENARILGETEKELSALRAIFAAQKTDDETTLRYLEILYEANRAELENLAKNPTGHELQIVNFLLSKKEPVLSELAIKNSAFSDTWKLSRAAETSLIFNKFAAENETYFTNALQTATIRDLVKQYAEEKPRLAGGDWFKLSNSYGKWLFAAEQREKADIYLAARIEFEPKSADEHFKLGYFYLQQKEFSRALEHFRLAAELRPEDKSFQAFTGAAHFQTGEREKAFTSWSKIIEGENPSIENALLYLKTLADFGQSAKARTDLDSIFLTKLKSSEQISALERQVLKEFVRAVAKTFADEAEKSAYFLKITEAAPDDTLLPQILIEEFLIAKRDFADFYKILIRRAEALDDYERDYDFAAIRETTFDQDEAEILYDAEKEFQFEEPENERLEWQKKYLEHLLETRDFALSAKSIREIEDSIKGKFPRPVWLRLADFRVRIGQSQADSAMSKMLRFTGIEISPAAKKTAPPDLERLNQAVEILQNANREDLAAKLNEAFFARQIALGQYNSANFSGLARIEFRKENALEALKILRIMTEFSADDRQSRIDSLPMVSKYSNKENLPVEPQNSLNSNESLKIAAEIATEFGCLAEAALFREKLREIAPGDAVNKIELARLYANLKSAVEAAPMLIEVVADKTIDRQTRWQSVIVLAEIGENDENFWRRILDENQYLSEQDTEIWSAINAISLFQTGQIDQAIGVLHEQNFTSELKFLKAIFEKNTGRDEAACKGFAEIIESDGRFQQIFGFYEAAPVLQTINLYLKTGNYRAALDRAKKREILKIAETTEASQNRDFKFGTLDVRARLMNGEQLRTALEKLSIAAETTGDLAQALEIELAQSGFIKSVQESENSAARIESLRQKIAAGKLTRTASFVVTDKTVSDF